MEKDWKKSSIFWTGILIIITLIAGVLVFFYTRNLQGYNNTDCWSNYFSFLGASLGFTGPVVIFFVEKKRAYERQMSENVYSKLDTIYDEKFKFLIPILIEIENNNITELDHKDFTKCIYLLNKMNELTKLTEGKEDELDFSDPYLNDPTIVKLVSSDAFKKYDNFIENNLPDIYEQLNKLQLKEVEGRPSIRFLGEWIISEKNANKAKILIGISGYNSKVEQIIKLPMYDGEKNNIKPSDQNNRKTFKVEDDSLLEIKASKPILESWASRNPVLYPNHFRNYKEEVRNYIKENVDKIDLDKINGKQDIIVVKSFLKDTDENVDVNGKKK